MNAFAERLKVQLVSQINEVEDEAVIQRMHAALQTILHEALAIELPTDEYLLKRAQTGIAQLEAGQFGGVEELKKAFARGLESGLKKRLANGFAQD
jgi:predicted transcriptional regulator